jgi:hypothetical protein
VIHPDDTFIAERRSSNSHHVARLFQGQDGRLYCECPYLCDATSEVCEFEGYEG